MKQHIFIAFALVSFISSLLLAAMPVMARVIIDANGGVAMNAGQVLSSNSGSGSSGSGGGEESESDSTGSSVDTEDSDSDIDTSNEDGTRTKTEVRDDGEVRTEVRLPDGTKVKTRTEADRTRTDVYQGGVKVRLERVDDRFRIKAESESGEETDLGENELISIDERADRNQIKIRTFAATADQFRNRVIVERLNTQALTDLPLSVDLATNELTVTTPAGEKTVTILPDQAVQNMLAANVIDRIGGEALVDLVQQGGVETLPQVIELSEQNGVPIYTMQGVKEHRVLGFIPVTIEVTVTVSAETGEVIDTDQSFIDSVLTAFSVAA